MAASPCKISSGLLSLNRLTNFSVALSVGREEFEMEQVEHELRALLGPKIHEKRANELLEGVHQESNLEKYKEVLRRLSNLKIALLVVDFQNDFTEGSMNIKNGPANQDPKAVLPSLNALLVDLKFDLVIYTLDWHPPNHISFYEHCRNRDRELADGDRARKLKPFDTVHFQRPNRRQVLYPSHCVAESWGADLDPKLLVLPEARTIRKGVQPFVDSYSAFFDNEKLNKTELETLLEEEGITAVLACGLAYEICVAATIMDAADLGYLSGIIKHCSAGLDNAEMSRANASFAEKGIAVMDKDEVSNIVHRRTVPLEWFEKVKNEVFGT